MRVRGALFACVFSNVYTFTVTMSDTFLSSSSSRQPTKGDIASSASSPHSQVSVVACRGTQRGHHVHQYRVVSTHEHRRTSPVATRELAGMPLTNLITEQRACQLDWASPRTDRRHLLARNLTLSLTDISLWHTV
jgi:hypothetical protein